MATPFLSVLIDTYNHERFIEQAILSVLAQDIAEGEREIIVVDDGSSDRTAEIVRRFEPRVRLIRKTNGGQASAFNAGIPACSGVGIAFLDGDDWWAPEKLRTVAEVFATDEAIGVIGHGIVESFENGVERTVAPEKAERFRLNSLAVARAFRLRKTYLGTSRMALRANVAREIVPAPESLVIEADEYLFTTVAYIPNGVEQRFFVPRTYEARNQLRLLYAGTWLDQRGILYLRDALRKVMPRIPALTMTFAGPGVPDKEILHFLGDNLASRIVVRPSLAAERMQELYAEHDIFVFPSLVEGLPNVLMEAMAGGMPVITTETCGMPDIIENEFNGLLIPPADASALEEAILRLANCGELRQRLGTAAREAMKRFTWERTARMVESLYKRTLIAEGRTVE